VRFLNDQIPTAERGLVRLSFAGGGWFWTFWRTSASIRKMDDVNCSASGGVICLIASIRRSVSSNFPSLLKTEVLREVYAETVYPANAHNGEAIRTFKDLYKKDTRHLGVIEKLFERGVYTRPRSWNK